MRSTGIEKHGCGNRVDRKCTQHDIGSFLSFFSIDMVQTSMGFLRNGIPSNGSFGTSRVGLGRIGARDGVGVIGALTGKMARLAASETSRISSSGAARGNRATSRTSTSRTRC